jgi:hypothetical protein
VTALSDGAPPGGGANEQEGDMLNISELIRAARGALEQEAATAIPSTYAASLERDAPHACADQQAETLAVVERLKAALKPADPWANGGWPGAGAGDLD